MGDVADGVTTPLRTRGLLEEGVSSREALPGSTPTPSSRVHPGVPVSSADFQQHQAFHGMRRIPGEARASAGSGACVWLSIGLI